VQGVALAVLLLPLRRFLFGTDCSTPERVGGVVVPHTKLEVAEYGTLVQCAALLVLLLPLRRFLRAPRRAKVALLPDLEHRLKQE